MQKRSSGYFLVSCFILESLFMYKHYIVDFLYFYYFSVSLVYITLHMNKIIQMYIVYIFSTIFLFTNFAQVEFTFSYAIFSYISY